jgi:hypothetical protein
MIYPGRKHVPFKARAFIDLVLETGSQSQPQRTPLAANRRRSEPEGRVAALAC